MIEQQELQRCVLNIVNLVKLAFDISLLRTHYAVPHQTRILYRNELNLLSWQIQPHNVYLQKWIHVSYYSKCIIYLFEVSTFLLSDAAYQFYLWVSNILENSLCCQKRDIISTRIFLEKNVHIHLYKNVGNAKSNDPNEETKIKLNTSRPANYSYSSDIMTSVEDLQPKSDAQ